MTTPERNASWNRAMTVRPGHLTHHVPADAIKGAIPEGLRGGRLLSNGPGWTQVGDTLAHPFDGHGYLRSYPFHADGSAELTARFVETEVYREGAAARHLTRRGLGTDLPGGLLKNLRASGGATRNVANTTVYRWNDRILAGWEAGEPHALDAHTLDTQGPHTFGGLVEGKITLAHMHADAATGRLLVVNIRPGRTTAMTFHELDAEERVVQTRTGTHPGGFVHDFHFTPSYYVVSGNPLGIKPMNVAAAFFGAKPFVHAIKPQTKKPGTLVLFPRTTQGEPRIITLPKPSFVVHFANAFEQDDGTVVVDACLFHDFAFGEEFGYRGPHRSLDTALPEARGGQAVTRITIPPGATEATWAPLTQQCVDFPRLNPKFEGQDAPYWVGATRRDTRFSDPFDSLVRIPPGAPEQEQLWTTDGTTFVGEPVVAEGTDGHDYVLAVLTNGLAETPHIAIFDADQLDAGPICRIPMPLMA